MSETFLPQLFCELIQKNCIDSSAVVSTNDGFFAVSASISSILETKNIFDFPDSSGNRLYCDRFFDDWYLYSLNNGNQFVYGLFKLREQEYDADENFPADGDTPGVTVSFISFSTDALMSCIDEPTDENRSKLSREINRVVGYRGQRHNNCIKQYFLDPKSIGSYIIADLYAKHIASFADFGYVETPVHYKKIVKLRKNGQCSSKEKRLPDFIDSLNEEVGKTVCDHERIYITDKTNLTRYERAAILATHTGNVSLHSFAAEVEYHARYLLPVARVRIPFIGKSIYESAIRADMTIDDTEFEGPAPFHRLNSKIVKRQRQFHPGED